VLDKTANKVCLTFLNLVFFHPKTSQALFPQKKQPSPGHSVSSAPHVPFGSFTLKFCL
jgi:hypothetical protein